MVAPYRGTAWIAGLIVVGLTPSALADSSYLEQARQAYAELEYDRVTPLLEKALPAAESPGEEAEVYELLAIMHVTYSREGEAQEAFLQLLQRKPNYEPPLRGSPKIRQAFALALEEHERLASEAAAAELEQTPPDDPATEPTSEPPPSDRDTRPPPEGGHVPPPVEGAATAVDSTRTGSSDSGGEKIEPMWLWIFAGSAASIAVIGVGAWAIYSLVNPPVPETDFGPYPL